MKLTNEQLKIVSNAKSAEELISIAKAENINLTKEQAENYFKAMHIENTGKVSDEELENVVGGTCYSKGKGVEDPYWFEQRRYAIVSPLNICPIQKPAYKGDVCGACIYSFRKGATWYCCDRWWENDHEVLRERVKG